MSVFADGFFEKGWAVAPGLFSGGLLRDMTEDFDRIVEQIAASGEHVNARWDGAERVGGADTVVIHTHNVHQYTPRWLDALRHEPFLEAARELLGPDVVMHHNKLFQKPPEKGAPFPMHQDWSYFPTRKDSMLAAVIHLTDATDEMGCLRFYSGSHMLGRLADSHGNTDTEILRRYPLEDAEPVPAKAGDVVFFHYFTIHGSMPNRSDKARKTVLVQMHSGDDCVEEGCGHPDERLPLCGWNHAMTRDRANRAD